MNERRNDEGSKSFLHSTTAEKHNEDQQVIVLQDMEVVGSSARSVRFVRFSRSPRNPESFLHFVGLDSGMFISDIVSPRSAASAAHLDLLDTLFARLEQLMAYTPSERDFVMLRHKFVVIG